MSYLFRYSVPLIVKRGGKGRRLEWNEKARYSFNLLKSKLSSAPLLAAPDFTKKFTIYCDASDLCIGGVLTPRKLRGAELNMSRCHLFGAKVSTIR